MLLVLASLASCKRSSSSASGSHVVIGLRMSFAEVRGSCPDHFDVHSYGAATVVKSALRHPVTLVGFGPNIVLRDCDLGFTLENDLVQSIAAACPRVLASRTEAETLIDGIGASFLAAGWYALPSNEPRDRTYGRDVHGATVNVQLIYKGTEADISGEKSRAGQRWVVDFTASDVSNGR